MPLTNGCNHVAKITSDLDRLIAFYREVFDADVPYDLTEGDIRHAMIMLGPDFALHPFQLAGANPHAQGSPEMFARGHLDHLALNVPDVETFELLRRRLVEHGATDGAVTDFGMTRSVWFSDPDGMGCEVAINVPGAAPLTYADRIVEPYPALQDA